MQLDRHFVFAGGLDRMLKDEKVTIDLAADLLLEALRQIVRRDRAESLAGLAGLKNEGDLELADAPGKLLGIIQLLGFAFGAFGLERVELTQSPRRDFVSLAGGQKKIARIAAAHLHDISFGPEAGDIFGEDNLGCRHENWKTRMDRCRRGKRGTRL